MKRINFTYDGSVISIDENSNCIDIMQLFARSFVEKMGFVDDDVLINSIGADRYREALKQGFMSRINTTADRKVLLERKLNSKTLWARSVLFAKHGETKGADLFDKWIVGF